MKNRAIALMAGLVTLLTGSAWAQSSWDAVADFRLDVNTAGAWSYQWRAPRGPARLMEFPGTDCADIPGVSCWRQGGSPGLEHLPMVGINTTGAPIQYGSVVVPVDALALHPGDPSNRAVVTWTAPAAGNYTATVHFELIEMQTTGVSVSVSVDGVTAKRRSLKVYGQSAKFELTRTLSAGQTVSFVVAPLGTYASGSTALRATVRLEGNRPLNGAPVTREAMLMDQAAREIGDDLVKSTMKRVSPVSSTECVPTGEITYKTIYIPVPAYFIEKVGVITTPGGIRVTQKKRYEWLKTVIQVVSEYDGTCRVNTSFYGTYNLTGSIIYSWTDMDAIDQLLYFRVASDYKFQGDLLVIDGGWSIGTEKRSFDRPIHIEIPI